MTASFNAVCSMYKITLTVNKTTNGVLCDVEYLFYQGVLYFRSIIWFHGLRVKVRKHGFLSADFRVTHKRSTALRPNLLC
jgi:hypothetical protein